MRFYSLARARVVLAVLSLITVFSVNCGLAFAKEPMSGKAKVTFYCRRCSPHSRVADPKRRASSPMGVAADPRYHPLGTRVYIEGFGVRLVDDTGGAIKGPNRFDVRLSPGRSCERNGVKRLKYRVVKKSSPRKTKKVAKKAVPRKKTTTRRQHRSR